MLIQENMILDVLFSKLKKQGKFLGDEGIKNMISWENLYVNFGCFF